MGRPDLNKLLDDATAAAAGATKGDADRALEACFAARRVAVSGVVDESTAFAWHAIAERWRGLSELRARRAGAVVQ